MSDSDDKLVRRYRELSREEPGAAVDAAILAASRRAVAAKPSLSRRWAMPVSVAAVLVLAFGVTLRMQQEKPGIESSVPVAPAPPAPAPSDPAPSAPASRAAAPPQPAFAPPQPAPAPMQDAQRASAPIERPKPVPARPAQDRLAEVAPPMRAPQSPLAAQPERPAVTLRKAESATAASSAPEAKEERVGAAPAPRFDPEPAAQTINAAPAAQTMNAAPAASPSPGPAPQRLKREAAADSAQSPLRALAAPVDPARELERIAKLREEGRHAEADKALEQFRRDHPALRIPDAVWERVRPR